MKQRNKMPVLVRLNAKDYLKIAIISLILLLALWLTSK